MLAFDPDVEPKTEGQVFTLGQRISLWFITWVGYLAIRLVGPTLRYTVTIEDGGPPDFYPHGSVFVFWHNAVIPACWWYRGRNIAVMTSSSFDGEYIARIIEKFGFRPVRGSSTRGGVRALLGMHTEIESDHSVAFTIDGPKGPVYIAKPGPALLARNVQRPIQAFYIAVEHAWILNSWDQFRIPKPFSRAHLRVAKPIFVPADTDSESVQRLHAEMQAALDRVRVYAEQQFKKL